ncbi:hypothetical protein ACF3NV_09105 [Moraxella atlantae]|uniref:hypothetical protein n=1 Tax=Faucicola atlantae TaxID=34059 RepID=UPI0037514F36
MAKDKKGSVGFLFCCTFLAIGVCLEKPLFCPIDSNIHRFIIAKIRGKYER